MTNYQHPSDGPQPMCSGPEGTGTTSNNPTWFAFLAWCTDLTLEVIYTNCSNPPGPSNGGIQAAVYSGCPATPFNAIACDTDVAGCDGDGQRTVSLSGLQIGKTYYFLVDGCAGSHCDIEINVIGSCTQDGFDDWPEPIEGARVVCLPNGNTPYFVYKIGAKQYYWYVDGVLHTPLPAEFNTATTINWANYGPGIHTLCIDGSNLPCIEESTFPEPLCTTVCVTPSPADAGDIGLSPPNPCPGATVNINVTGNNTAPDFNQYTFITDASGTIIQVVNGTTTTFTHDGL